MQFSFGSIHICPIRFPQVIDEMNTEWYVRQNEETLRPLPLDVNVNVTHYTTRIEPGSRIKPPRLRYPAPSSSTSTSPRCCELLVGMIHARLSFPLSLHLCWSICASLMPADIPALRLQIIPRCKSTSEGSWTIQEETGRKSVGTVATAGPHLKVE